MGLIRRIFIVEEKAIQNSIKLKTTSLYISTTTFQVTIPTTEEQLHGLNMKIVTKNGRKYLEKLKVKLIKN